VRIPNLKTPVCHHIPPNKTEQAWLTIYYPLLSIIIKSVSREGFTSWNYSDVKVNPM